MYENVCEEHIKTKLVELESKSSSVDTRTKLTMLDTIWRDHCKAFILIINLFLKLDRSSQCGGLWDLGIEIFGRLIREKSIEEQTVNASRCFKLLLNIDLNKGLFKISLLATLVFCG